MALPQGAALLVMALSYALLVSERHGHPYEHPAVGHMHWHRHGDSHHEHAHEGLGFVARLFGHSHAHEHEALSHVHPHVSDLHNRHEHG